MKTLIAIPCMDMVYTKFAEALTNLKRPENTACTFVQNTLIYHGRNVILDNAIKYGFDRVFWLDSDIKFESDTLMKLSADMDETGYDFISGLYFMRMLPTKPVIYSKVWWEAKDNGWVGTGRENYYNYPEGLFEVEGAGFGCVLTSVRLLHKMREAYGAPFTPLMGMGEDLAFCWRMGQLGEKLYCDSRVKCEHIGLKTYFEEDYERPE